MTFEEIHRQWLAAHCVALFGPRMPVTKIRDWTSRDFLDKFYNPKPGKNNPWKFSLAHAVQLHGAYIEVSQGATVLAAMRIGKLMVQRLEERVTNDDPDELLEEPWALMAHYVDTNGTLHHRYWPKERLCDLLMRTQWLVPPKNDFSKCVRVLPVDELLHTLIFSYRGVDVEFNEKALAGKLKPFPKELR